MKNAFMSLEPSLVSLIERKANEESGSAAIKYSSTYIQQLNNYIDGTCSLTVREIEEKIDYLVGCLTITLDYPIGGLELLRVRRCENRNNFNNVDDLSYIKNTNSNFPAKGRLNKAGELLFYAALILNANDIALQVVLSEARSKSLDQFNVLKSCQIPNTSLNVRVIGIWDHVRCNYQPYYINDNTYAYYEKVASLMEDKFEPDLLRAYQLTDRFLSDLLSRKSSPNLYQVTSEISSIILEGAACDGILYSSVEGSEEPVIALKPDSVDAKINHQFVSCVFVEHHLGYEFYNYQTKAVTKSIIRQSGKLVW